MTERPASAGAIVGVGLLEGAKGVNWKQFSRQFIAWVCTLAIVGLLTAALFAQVSTLNLNQLNPLRKTTLASLCPLDALCSRRGDETGVCVARRVCTRPRRSITTW